MATLSLVKSPQNTKVTQPAFQKKEWHRGERGDLTEDLFEAIREVALDLAESNNEYLGEYLKHPTQTELIEEFKRRGMTITPRHTAQYSTKMGDELLLFNQKVGFVYTQQRRAA